MLDALGVTALKYSESRGELAPLELSLASLSGGPSLNSPVPNSSRLTCLGPSASDGDELSKPATLSFPYYRRPTGGFSLF